MNAIEQQHALSWRGRWMMDGDESLIGIIRDIYLENETDEPRWAAVGTSRIGWRTRLVPIEEATLEDNKVQVPYDREQVRTAPQIDGDELSPEDEAMLSQHYGLVEPRSAAGAQGSGDPPADPRAMSPDERDPVDPAPRGLTVAAAPDRQDPPERSPDADSEPHERAQNSPVPIGRRRAREQAEQEQPAPVHSPAAPSTTQGVGHDALSDGSDDIELILAAEELSIERDLRQVSRAVIHKHVDIERLQTTVEVRREQLRVDREPIDESQLDELSLSIELTEQSFEVALMGEQVRVERRIVPKERILVHKELATEQVTIDEPVRRERLSVETDEQADALGVE